MKHFNKEAYLSDDGFKRAHLSESMGPTKRRSKGKLRKQRAGHHQRLRSDGNDDVVVTEVADQEIEPNVIKSGESFVSERQKNQAFTHRNEETFVSYSGVVDLTFEMT